MLRIYPQKPDLRINRWDPVNSPSFRQIFSIIFVNRDVPDLWIPVTIIGEKGVLTLDLPYCNLPGETGTVHLINESNYKKIDTTAFGDSMRKNFSSINFDEKAYNFQVESVNSTILKGTKPTITLEDSKNNIKTILALLKSAKKNIFMKV